MADVVDISNAGPASRMARPGPAASQSVQLVIRRRRVLAVLLGAAAVLAVVSSVPPLGPLVWLAGAAAVMAAAYLALVTSITHARGRRELVGAFRRSDSGADWDWTALEDEVSLGAAMGREAAPAVSVGNTALARFVCAYALGWVLTPLVILIRLVRGDLSDLERSGVVGRIVSWQQYGRSQSLRLLVVGAATVGVTTSGIGAVTTMLMPGTASAAAAGPSYVVQPGDTLGAIAARYGTTVPVLSSLNGIADPNFIVPGEVIHLPGGASQTAPPPTASPASGSHSYTVQPGDTLGAIAARFGTTVAALAAANHIADPNLIFAGQVLQVSGTAGAGPSTSISSPHGGTYTVRPGDTLGALAARYGTTVAALAAANHIANPNFIFVGEVLTIPGGGAGSSGPSGPGGSGAGGPGSGRSGSGGSGSGGSGSGGSGSGGSGRTTSPPPASPAPRGASGYINPFRYGSWAPSRTDEGVDWIPNVTSPVVAIGDGIITYSSMNSGWPAGGFIAYRLTNGSHAGDYVYVAEHITALLPVGTLVSAGERIATALPGYPWTEWGWASASGPEPAPSARYNGSADGTATPGGKAFARFLIELGVSGVQNPGPGTDAP
jgi:LysM repeat protein